MLFPFLAHQGALPVSRLIEPPACTSFSSRPTSWLGSLEEGEFAIFRKGGFSWGGKLAVKGV